MAFCEKYLAAAEAGEDFGIPTQNTDDYRQGVAAVCKAFLNKEELHYKGPQHVIASLEAMEP